LAHFTRGKFFIPNQDQIVFLSFINFNQELLSSFFQSASSTYTPPSNRNEENSREKAKFEGEINNYKQKSDEFKQKINELQD
jgi:hypothetical protein